MKGEQMSTGKRALTTHLDDDRRVAGGSTSQAQAE